MNSIKIFSIVLLVSIFLSSSTIAYAEDITTTDTIAVPQGSGGDPIPTEEYIGDLDSDTQITVDVVMGIQNQSKLEKYIKDVVSPNSKTYRQYLSVQDFAQAYAPSETEVSQIVQYFQMNGLEAVPYPNNLVIKVKGKTQDLNKALQIRMKKAFHKNQLIYAPEGTPRLPKKISKDILCILGLSNYSNLEPRLQKQPMALANSMPDGPRTLTPQDLIEQYNLQPLYDKGLTGAGQTIGIVTLAEFNPYDPVRFWENLGISTKPNRIHSIHVDGPSDWVGFDETTLDVEQAGAIAPQADINVYIGQKGDVGFLDAFANAINDNQAQQLSVSWGQPEVLINELIDYSLETHMFAMAFQQLFMQAAAQGIGIFAASGDAGSYDAFRTMGQTGLPGTYSLTVDFPASSPYVTAAGGTSLPVAIHSDEFNLDLVNEQERAWGWDYMYPLFDAAGLKDDPSGLSAYLVGGGGGFSELFDTPDYQKGMPGVNKYYAIKQWTPSPDASSISRDSATTIDEGKGNGRNVPDLSMNADPNTGYMVFFSEPNANGANPTYLTYGGTSFVAPQLSGVSALINSFNNSRTGFWNPQIYSFAQNKSSSPFQPLNSQGPANDNLYYSSTKDALYNQSSGLGIPNFEKLFYSFTSEFK